MTSSTKHLGSLPYFALYHHGWRQLRQPKSSRTSRQANQHNAQSNCYHPILELRKLADFKTPFRVAGKTMDSARWWYENELWRTSIANFSETTTTTIQRMCSHSAKTGLCNVADPQTSQLLDWQQSIRGWIPCRKKLTQQGKTSVQH
jgi:hypothetical protein